MLVLSIKLQIVFHRFESLVAIKLLPVQKFKIANAI